VRCGGFVANARKILLATGLEDEVPGIKGIERFFGVSVHHCPYCDAFEHRNSPIAVYGPCEKGAQLALMLKQWSLLVFLCTNGPARLTAEISARLRNHQIPVYSELVAELEGTEDGELRRIKLTNGKWLDCSCMFFATSSRQRSDISAALGCQRDEKGGIVTDPITEESSVRGVFVAGDASREVLLVSVAMAEGAKAGVAINRALLREEGLLI
jgi:thioredoxin reductase